MKTKGNYIRGLLIAIMFSSLYTAFSQYPGWDMLYLGKTLTSNNKYAVGGSCLIFSETSSNHVYAFSSISGAWDSTSIATTLAWTYATAGEKCAILLNDSLAVFYSAINHDFTVLRFEGQMGTVNRISFGCYSTIGYLVTNSKVYVFDSEDSQIRSTNYSSGEPTFIGNAYTSDDYLCLYLYPPYSGSPVTLVAYSCITKTISEYTNENMPMFRHLEHGFIFGNVSGHPYYCGGYSSYTGTFVTKTSDIIISDVLHQYDLNRVYPRLCYQFNSRSAVNPDGIATLYLWVFNTITGSFDDFSYNYDYNNSHLIPSNGGTGGQGIFHTTYDKDNGDKVNLITYDVYSRAFTQHDFDIVYDYRNVLYIGGHIIAVTTKDKLVFYDILSGKSAYYYSDWQSEFARLQSIELGNNYVTTLYYPLSSGTQEKTAFSYNGRTGSLIKVSFSPTNSYSDVFGTINYSLIEFVNYTQAAEHLIYSEVNDSWLVKNVPSGNITAGKTGFYFLMDKNVHTTSFFNARSGNEIVIPASSSGTNHFTDSIFVMPGNDQNYYGYSAITNSFASYPLVYYSSYDYKNNIYIYYSPLNPTNPGNLLFDGNLGIFVTLNTNSQTHGSRILTKAGEKTALTVFSKGYLFAYDPSEITSIEEANKDISSVAYQLQQNYPNPFKTDTKIRWKLANNGHVVLKIFDFTGREIRTLVNENQLPGEHKVIFNAKGLPAGVYFYQLRATGIIETKKMIVCR